MSNQSTNWNSPDYFKLFDEIGTLNGGGGGGSSDSDTNIGNGNNFNFGSFDFYGNSLANGIGSNNNGTIVSSTVPSIQSTVNQTFQYQYDYGGGNEPHNQSIRSYESGSNFMLLMEDFSAYFYNYNGSIGTGIGTTTTTQFNYTGFELQTNCSLSNSTCNDNLGEFLLFFLMLSFPNQR